ncbi:MAG TPA: insulinase family protein, partial [Vicinamibacterales bacterium]|nr:insulinase family protein [Vicinamibacterales bacterium]
MKLKAALTLGLFGALTAIVAGQAVLDKRQEQRIARSASEGAQARVDWPRDNPPRPLPARPVTFPPYEIRKLSNGMQVVLVSQNEQPAISVRMIIRAGAAHDPKGKHGLAMMTATLLDQGAGSRTAAEIAEEIDFIGGALGTGAGTDLSFINAVVMNDSYHVALGLMSDIAMRPTFAQEEIDRQRS